MCGLFCLTLTLLATPEGAWAAKPLSEAPPSTVAEKLRVELDATATQVMAPSGDVVMNVWLRTKIPAQANAEQVKNGLSYREIPEGTWLGVVQFPKAFTDSRKQVIPAGVYSLRFALQPDVGDHVGTVPHPEFALLSPIEKETKPDVIEVKELLKQSRAAAGGDHPGVMLLFPVKPTEGELKIAKKEDRFQVVQIARMLVLDSGDKVPLVVGFTVDGYSKTR